MDFTGTPIPGVVVVQPDVHPDQRGFFLETYHAEKYRSGGIDVSFVQDNHSRSSHGTLRGLHLQLAHPQGKLIRVVSGKIWDVAVDVRRGSPTFGQHVAVELTSDLKNQMFVPAGLAHGFLVLSETADVEYKCTEFYDPDSELSVAWDDPRLAIPWPLSTPVLSEKDAAGLTVDEAFDQLPEV